MRSCAYGGQKDNLGNHYSGAMYLFKKIGAWPMGCTVFSNYDVKYGEGGGVPYSFMVYVFFFYQ